VKYVIRETYLGCPYLPGWDADLLMVPQLDGVNNLIEMGPNSSYHVLVLLILAQKPLDFTCNSGQTTTLSNIVCCLANREKYIGWRRDVREFNCMLQQQSENPENFAGYHRESRHLKSGKHNLLKCISINIYGWFIVLQYMDICFLTR
jgi:hypothetical protein